MSKPDVSSDDEPGSVNYTAALRVVRGIVEAEERVENFFVRPERQTEMSNLASSLNEVIPSQTRAPAKAPDAADKTGQKGKQQEDAVDMLTKSLSALTLPLTAAISELKAAATKAPERPAETSGGSRLDPAFDRRPGPRYGQPGRSFNCFMCNEEGHPMWKCAPTSALNLTLLPNFESLPGSFLGRYRRFQSS
jgi:hypothetical protein